MSLAKVGHRGNKAVLGAIALAIAAAVLYISMPMLVIPAALVAISVDFAYPSAGISRIVALFAYFAPSLLGLAATIVGYIGARWSRSEADRLPMLKAWGAIVLGSLIVFLNTIWPGMGYGSSFLK